MTLIAVHSQCDEIQILADGLASNDKLIEDSNVPSRTTQQKLFRHPTLPIAICQLGKNDHLGVPISEIVEACFTQISIDDFTAVAKCLGSVFNKPKLESTLWFVGYDDYRPVIRPVIGDDFIELGNGRYWGGSGTKRLPQNWTSLGSLRALGDDLVRSSQSWRPYNLPFFPDHFGGHWHGLTVRPHSAPEWTIKPVNGLIVSELFEVTCDSINTSGDAAVTIEMLGEKIKERLRQKFNKKFVRDSLKEIADLTARQMIARLVAIFDEVKSNRSAESSEDVIIYARVMDYALSLLDKPGH